MCIGLNKQNISVGRLNKKIGEREREKENALLDKILELRKVKQKDKFVVVVVPKQVIKIDFLLDFYWDFTLASYCSHFSSIRFLL